MPRSLAEFASSATHDGGGTVFAIGANGQGQLGDGSATEKHVPVEILLGGDITTRHAVAICAGYQHAGVITLSGAVFMFGRNDHCQLGDGTSIDRHTPVEITALGADTAQLAAGAYHTVARKVGGGIWSWGWNHYGQIGDGTTTDQQLPLHIATLGFDNAFVLAQEYGNILLKVDGRAFGWGANAENQITHYNAQTGKTQVIFTTTFDV